ncbi:calcium-binding protein [Microvirga lenta]|uniref:calcium-binding protein n=1 Tax=Microvirga lenta TaxID=2881337 RepID=UPI00299F0413|nr:calcium-binding protein [Microvirga lenta]
MTYRIWGTESIAQLGGADFDNVVAALPNGGYVAAFFANTSIYFQRYDGAGAKLGAPVHVAAENGVNLDDIDVHAIGPNGNFAIAWAENVGTTSSAVKVIVFNADGLRFAGPINIASFGGSGDRSDVPSIVGADDGGFVAVYNDPTNAAGVKLSVYDADGTFVRALDLSTPDGHLGDITKIGTNKYVVSYQTNNDDKIKHKIVDLGVANPIGPEIEVGVGTISDVVQWVNGGYAVIYKVAGGDNSVAVQAKFFEANGAPAGNMVTITSNGERAHDNFEATALRDGRIAVVYSERVGNPTGTPSDFGDIFLKIINTDGSTTAPLLINSDATTDTNDAQVVPSVTEMADGRLALSWHDRYNQDRVLTNIVDVREAAVTVNGTSGNDVYAGSEYHGNVLNGHGGNDKLIGGSGSDALDGGEGIDVASYERSAAGVIVSLAGGPGIGGDAAGDTYANIENVIGSQHGDTITGDDAANHLWGLGGDDVISGNDGNDSLYGGTGEDVLSGGSGFDYLRGDAGNDTLDGGADNDFLDGGVGFDFLVGNVGDDTLNGGADNDVLDGGLGSDNLIGDLGDDALFGGDGNDILIGGVGNDRLDGGAGNDKLYGKEGKDFLVGGSGRDIFVFDTRPNKRTNLDTVDDFNVRDDSIYLENKYFKKLGKKGSESKPAKLKRDFFKVGTKALDKNDHLVYNKKKGILYYDADGSGRSKAVEIAKLDKNLKMSYKDFFVI